MSARARARAASAEPTRQIYGLIRASRRGRGERREGIGAPFSALIRRGYALRTDVISTQVRGRGRRTRLLRAKRHADSRSRNTFA
jgi:hypothetical protein